MAELKKQLNFYIGITPSNKDNKDLIKGKLSRYGPCRTSEPDEQDTSKVWALLEAVNEEEISEIKVALESKEMFPSPDYVIELIPGTIPRKRTISIKFKKLSAFGKFVVYVYVTTLLSSSGCTLSWVRSA